MIAFIDLRKNIFNLISASRLAFPMLIAGFVGVATGLTVVAFIKGIELSQNFFWHQGLPALRWLGKYGIILIPALGGLLVGLLVTYAAPETRGHGVPEVLKAIALRKGKIPPKVIPVKAVASAISIGSGASVGREGPAVQIGAAIGSVFGRILKLNEVRVRNLIACGTAGGISAVFNAPITGVMFALEIILRDFGARTLSTVVVASVASSVMTRIFLGDSPAFIIPPYSLQHPLEIFLYLLLGILSAIAAVGFIQMLELTEGIFNRWKIPLWVKPAVGGLAIGSIGLYFPQVFGMGFHTIENAFHANLDLKILMALFILKMVATSLSLGSGSSGGTFAPSLFVGAVLGSAFGKIIFNHVPFATAPPGAYAIVGMSSVFAGAFHAPVTAIFLVFEMTGDYKIILPLMIGSVIASSVSQIILRESMDTIKLKQSGIDIAALEEVRMLSGLEVRDAMSQSFDTLPAQLGAKELIEKLSREKDKSFFVVNEAEDLLGMVKPEDIQSILFEKNIQPIIAMDIATPLTEYVFMDEPLSQAAKIMLMNNLRELPVLDSTNPKKIQGILRSEDIFRAYTDLTTKRADLITRMEQPRVTESDTVSLQFMVGSRSPLIGKTIKESGLPQGIVLTSIERRRKIVVPGGNTAFHVKDKIWAVATTQNEAEFRAWLNRNHLKLYS